MAETVVGAGGAGSFAIVEVFVEVRLVGWGFASCFVSFFSFSFFERDSISIVSLAVGLFLPVLRGRPPTFFRVLGLGALMML